MKKKRSTNFKSRDFFFFFCVGFKSLFRKWRAENANKIKKPKNNNFRHRRGATIYAIGFSSWIGDVGAVLLVELAMSLKLCTDPERDVETFVYEKKRKQFWKRSKVVKGHVMLVTFTLS